MAHREGIRDYLKDVETYGVVHDWGCGTKPIKNYLKPSPALFITIDKLDHVGADIVEDMEDLEMLRPQHRADFVFCIEVLEHVWKPKNLLKNIKVNMVKGAVLYLSQPFMYEVHKEDDRVRYTHHGLKKLLEDAGFTVEDIQPTVGDLDHAEGYIVKARK